MASKGHIVVVGAGVTGLTSACFLGEAGYDVTVVAAHVPGDSSIEYTSPWAGAHWRTHATPEEPMLCDWDVQTFDYWLDVMEREKQDPKLPKSGLKMYDSLHYWDAPVKEELWWAPRVKNFRALSSLQEPLLTISKRIPAHAPAIKEAAACRAMSVNVPQYLLYLQEKARSMGAKVIKARLPVGSGLEDALTAAESHAMVDGGRRPDCFVNATGLGAAKLCGDEAMYPIRGQTVLVKGEAEAIRTRIGDGYTAYCIPRPGAGMTILGGTKEVGNWSEAVDPETTARILQNCSYIVPELLTGEDGGFEVVSAQCGLRPARQDGPRMEKEVVGGRKTVHAYGHAGAGYQNSIGSARLVVKMVGESIGSSIVSAKL
ncbi:hypothetical protein LTR36_001901 [Oleoguttula mirabilis]|uniref:FAD dependent oxidoreductase domain-containing protein n=1 Tax=Oleoguttula mirabilis TaxID=1507867 RepID=A0AAV9JNU2_9PEZI|nr:hypothetical protein LTR36_001901 [Oleoguttula mirabilis]